MAKWPGVRLAISQGWNRAWREWQSHPQAEGEASLAFIGRIYGLKIKNARKPL